MMRPHPPPLPGTFLPIIDADIFGLRPDYCAISIIAEGIDNVTQHPVAATFRDDLARQGAPSWRDNHLDAWRAAYRAFGAKPQRTPASVDALLSRLNKTGQLPAVNAVVDLYNAVSVRYVIPVGGENMNAYVGHPRLLRAAGTETFDTTKDGEPILEAVPAGEVVWADDRGATCRRWNWRQGVRTRIDLQTNRMWFVLERLEPMPVDSAEEAGTVLVRGLRQISPGATFSAHRIDRAGRTALLLDAE